MDDVSVFSSSVRGESHIAKGTPCEDASGNYESDKLVVISVADGLGDEALCYSHVGSRIAVDVSIEVIKKYFDHEMSDAVVESLKNTQEQNNIMLKIEKEILDLWRKRVKENFFEKQSKHKSQIDTQSIYDLYSTTLVVAARTPSFWFVLHIGDGNCVSFDLVTENGGTVLGYKENTPNAEPGYSTKALSMEKAMDHFRHEFSFSVPPVIFIHTDGIDDCTLSADYIKLTHLKLTYQLTEYGKDGIRGIEDIMLFFSKTDDVSVAVMTWEPALVELRALIESELHTCDRQYKTRRITIKRDELIDVRKNILLDYEQNHMAMQKLKAEQDDKQARGKAIWKKREEKKLAIEECKSQIAQLELRLQALQAENADFDKELVALYSGIKKSDDLYKKQEAFDSYYRNRMDAVDQEIEKYNQELEILAGKKTQNSLLAESTDVDFTILGDNDELSIDQNMIFTNEY